MQASVLFLKSWLSSIGLPTTYSTLQHSNKSVKWSYFKNIFCHLTCWRVTWLWHYIIIMNEGYSQWPACMAYHCSPPFSLSLSPWVYEAILPEHGLHFKQLLSRSKVLNTLIYCCYLLVRRWPPCTYCPDLSSKFHHLTPKQPSDSKGISYL